MSKNPRVHTSNSLWPKKPEDPFSWKKWPPIPEAVVLMLEDAMPTLDYHPDNKTEDYAFRGGQRAIVLKLRHILNKQKAGE